MQFTSTRLLAVVLCACLLPRGMAEAGTVQAMSLEQMTDRAEMIFIGRVLGKRAEWSSDRTRIYTYIMFEVERYLKGGSDSKTATIRVWGGRVGPYIAMVPGSPQFVVGEDVLLFCSGSRARIPTVLGLSLGKFTITTDASGEAILKRDVSSLMLANHRTDAREPGDPITRYRLADVESRIQQFLE